MNWLRRLTQVEAEVKELRVLGKELRGLVQSLADSIKILLNQLDASENARKSANLDTAKRIMDLEARIHALELIDKLTDRKEKAKVLRPKSTQEWRAMMEAGPMDEESTISA